MDFIVSFPNGGVLIIYGNYLLDVVFVSFFDFKNIQVSC